MRLRNKFQNLRSELEKQRRGISVRGWIEWLGSQIWGLDTAHLDGHIFGTGDWLKDRMFGEMLATTHIYGQRRVGAAGRELTTFSGIG
jgi:hypothetical protein